MRRALAALAALVLIGAAAALWLSRPDPLAPSALAGLSGDAARGADVFWAAGCASCHTAPGSDDDLVLAGGQRFVSDFGTFLAPNISSDPVAGLGGWSDLDIANAVIRGLSPDGRHYYPAFPYTAYARITPQDMADLIAFLRDLPADATPSLPHEVGFPFNLRRGIGLWKALYLRDDWVMPDPGAATPLPEPLARGRYLVEALAHCAECHTPRNALGALESGQWMRGAPNPSGEGRIPGITPGQLGWDALDIAYYLETGFTPDFDSAGGAMARVVRGFARLGDDDRAAVAAYLLALE